MLKQFRVRNNMVRYFTHAMKQFNLFSFVSVVCVIAKDWYRANIGNMDFFFFLISTLGLLIRTFISKNQGLEKLRSVSNLRKNFGPAHLDFFQVSGTNQAFF